MQIQTTDQLLKKKCDPCEGGVSPCTLNESIAQSIAIPDWKISEDSKRLSRSVRFKNFARTVDCLNRIAALAESEAHHPDLHVTGYRNLAIELTTHAIGGLSVNDFIVAAKIDALIQKEFPECKNNP